MKNGKSAKELSIILKNQCAYYAKFGHHTDQYNAPIEKIKADAESVYRSKLIKEFCNQKGINIEFSPPHAHEYNGLIESHNKIIANKLTAFYASSPWMPEALWHYGWQYADATENMRPTKRSKFNMSRTEDFTSQKPNFKSSVYLPWGQPVEAYIPKAQRTGKFKEKSFTGMYLGPSENIVGGILIWNPITKTAIDRDTYRLVPYVPETWVLTPKTIPFQVPLTSSSNDEQDNTPVSIENPPTQSKQLNETETINTILINNKVENIPNDHVVLNSEGDQIISDIVVSHSEGVTDNEVVVPKSISVVEDLESDTNNKTII